MTPARIVNPILPGFHPDPSLLRVGDDYYVATSTFEWFPGVAIHHSRDLVHWRLIGHALTRPEQLPMAGTPRSGGVWAPCLSYADGLFYLIFTNTKRWGFGFADFPNYLVTAESIDGPWSDPIYLNSSGFDPSLYHAADGRKWLLNMLWDHRPGRDRFPGIVLQEYSPERRKLVGEPELIFTGSPLGVTEGPHVYRRGDYFYLMVAEGGTSESHAVTVARSKQLRGPYELDPQTPLLTSKDHPELPLQKAGHASLVETQTGEWFIAHLCGRPVGDHGRCILGRETALQRVEWTDDGWLRLEGGGNSPRVELVGPKLPPHPFQPLPARDDFDSPKLRPHYQTPRVAPDESWLSLTERPGHLRLRGRQSPASIHHQSLLARRVQSLQCRFETSVEFEPKSFQQLAGLMCVYDDENFFYAHVTWDEELGRCLDLLVSNQGKYASALQAPIALDSPKVLLRAEFATLDLTFSYSLDGQIWQPLGPTQDATWLSDEYTSTGLGFTGAFAGMAAHDMSGRLREADFDYFEYVEL